MKKIKSLLIMLPIIIISIAVFSLIMILISPKNLPAVFAESKSNDAEDTGSSYKNLSTDQDKLENYIQKTSYKFLKYIDNQILNEKGIIPFVINKTENLKKSFHTAIKVAELNMSPDTYLSGKTRDRIKIDDSELTELYIKRDYPQIVKKYSKKYKDFEPKFRYPIAYSLYKEDDYDLAVEILESIKEKDTVFYDYVLYYKALSYYYDKKYEKASDIFRTIRNKYPNFRHMNTVITKEAQSYYNNGYNKMLFSRFSDFNTAYYPDIDMWLCNAYYHYKDYDKALSYGKKVILYKSKTRTREVIEIVKGILGDKKDLSHSEKLLLSKGYFTMGEYDHVVSLLEDISFRDDNTEYDRLYYLLSSYWRLGRHKDTINILDRLRNNYSGSIKDKAEYLTAELLIDQGKKSEARPILEEIASKKGHEYRKESVEKLLDITLEAEEYSKMFDYLKIMMTDYNTRFDTWQPYIVPLLNKNEFKTLVREFPDYIKANNHNRFGSQLYFWLGCSYEYLEDWDNAYSSFEKAIEIYNNHYYHHHALKHIKSIYRKHLDEVITLKPGTKSPYDIEKDIDRRLKDFLKEENTVRILQSMLAPREVKIRDIMNEQGIKAIGLLEIGEISEGLSEWQRYFKSLDNRGDYLLYFMNLFYNTKIYHKSISYCETIINKLNVGVDRNYIPKSIIRFSYPQYYDDYVREIAERHGVDYKLVYSVIREESRFYHLAVSWAGAEGLMQLMPSTGRWLSDILKRDRYTPFDPYENIYLGSKFLSDLLNNYDHPHMAVGAYNAGGGRMNRYVRSFYKDYKLINIEHFVENIPIKETRYYIVKVMGSYLTYNKIYQ